MKWKLFLFAVFTVMVCLGCTRNELENLPAEFLGQWETATPKYKGFTFVLTEKTIIFIDTNAEGERKVHGIDKRTKYVDKDNKAIYTVYYETNDGLDFKFAFYYKPSDGGQITLKNQPGIIWTKRPGSVKLK